MKRMLTREVLEDVKHVITHARCPDGIASAVLLNDVLEGVPITFLSHGTPELETLRAEPGLLLVDITPPEKRVREFVDAGSIVLDHHIKQRAIVEAFGARGVFADEPGISGAMLAFEQVWSFSDTEGSDPYERAHYFARLAGVRDTWQTKDDRWGDACAQAEALRFYPWSTFAKVRSPFGYIGNADLMKLLAVGPILIARTHEQVKQLVREAWGATLASGSKLMVISSLETSDVAEAVGDAADYVIGFKYIAGLDRCSLVLSMRSHTGKDVGAFAKLLGGGGHRAAAGASIAIRGDALNPYATILATMNDLESVGSTFDTARDNEFGDVVMRERPKASE